MWGRVTRALLSRECANPYHAPTNSLTLTSSPTPSIHALFLPPPSLLFRAKPVKVTLATTSAVKTANAEFKNFEVKAVTSVRGFKITAIAKPATPSLSLNPVKLNTKPSSVEVNAEVGKDRVTVFFDNLQKLASDKKFAPRVKAEQKVVVAGETFVVDCELAMKGNVKPSDVITASVKGPKVGGKFTPKATYSNGPKGLVLNVAGDVTTDTNVELKAEHFPSKPGAPTQFTGIVTQKMPENMKCKLTLKDDLSGSVELHKGNAWIEAPIGAKGGSPALGDVVFKFKKTFDLDL